MFQTPFERLLESALQSRGYRLSEPIYRQDFTAGVEADAIFRKGSAQEINLLASPLARKFIPPGLRFLSGWAAMSDCSIGEPSLYIARRRIARKNEIKIQLDTFLDYELYRPKWTPKQVEQAIRSAFPVGKAVEFIEVVSYDPDIEGYPWFSEYCDLIALPTITGVPLVEPRNPEDIVSETLDILEVSEDSRGSHF